MKRTWRLLDTGCRSCSQNLALDKALLTSGSFETTEGTLRFFRFNTHSVMLGLYQKAEQEIRMDYCQKQGIEVNRRLTGGSAVYCDDSVLGWEVLLPREGQPLSGKLRIVGEKIGEAIGKGLAKLGVAVCCLQNKIEAQGRELGWIGAASNQDVLLFQGYIRINRFNAEHMLRALRVPNEKLQNKQVELFKGKHTCLKWIVGKTVPIDVMKQVITDGFAEVFDISLIPGELTSAEEALHFTCDNELSQQSWIASVPKNASSALQNNLRYTFKEGCTINISLLMDYSYREIQAASISGDFFSFPHDAISQLEMELRGSAKPEIIKKKIGDFFKDGRSCIMGLSLKDVFQVIIHTLEKARLIKLGLCTESEINDITVIGNVLFGATSDNPYDQRIPLLLPYCAKKPTCKFRNIEGCMQCGACDIGYAYELTKEYDLEPITIQNFEMLEERLIQLKSNGCPFFIGTCCEAFSVKHRKDFERIGLPGILINVNNSTCYELGEEQDAYQGNFANQTLLKRSLLRSIVQNYMACI